MSAFEWAETLVETLGTAGPETAALVADLADLLADVDLAETVSLVDVVKATVVGFAEYEAGSVDWPCDPTTYRLVAKDVLAIAYYGAQAS